MSQRANAREQIVGSSPGLAAAQRQLSRKQPIGRTQTRTVGTKITDGTKYRPCTTLNWRHRQQTTESASMDDGAVACRLSNLSQVTALLRLAVSSWTGEKSAICVNSLPSKKFNRHRAFRAVQTCTRSN